MDLNTVSEVARPRHRDNLAGWRHGDAFLAGGTWLFSEPQPEVSRLIDLEGLGWPSIEVNEHGLTLAATCRIAELYHFAPPGDWTAAPLIGQCCRALLASFKIWNAATVGGNICLSLPAGALIALTTALQGSCLIWQADGGERRLPVEQFVTGVHENVLQPGEVLRSVHVPAAALRMRTAFRQISLSTLGRSAVLLIGTFDPIESSFALAVTAATLRPVRLEFAALPSATVLADRIAEAIPEALYYDDVNGAPAYRRHMTRLFAEEIRREFAEGTAQ